MLEAILKLFRSFRRPFALSAPAVGDSNLRNVDKACDKIDYSGKLPKYGFYCLFNENLLLHFLSVYFFSACEPVLLDQPVGPPQCSFTSSSSCCCLLCACQGNQLEWRNSFKTI